MIYGIIPARLDSTRLPRKLLLAETGKPLIQHTWESVCRAKSLDAVIVATDSEEIAAAVLAFGGRVEMTGRHNSGTDRVAEVARGLPDADLIVNIQGDEPEIDPGHIDKLAGFMLGDEAYQIGTLATPLEDPSPESVVKVVCTTKNRAVYFSRQPIPTGGPWLQHIGVYAFRPIVLPHFAAIGPQPLEQSERLEQLRWREWGFPILVITVDSHATGIDTPEDYWAFVERNR